jgi:predicted RNA binding protein YcfA (HicA-like mRNA interferase family)
LQTHVTCVTIIAYKEAISVTGKELVKKLQKNGWKVDRIQGSHHIMVKDNDTISVPVHAGKDLPAGTLNEILKKAGLK